MDGPSLLEKNRVTVVYQLEPDLTAEAFIDVLVRSTLAERRPTHDAVAIQGMLRNADVLVTARVDGLLVGVSRALTDFAFCTYLSDLAVDEQYQRQGIGRELIRRTHLAAGLQAMLILLAAPKAQTYYPHIGMTRHESCWITPRTTDPRFIQKDPAEDSQH
jgi:GNAT superfamily N-acetyltransferase